jgi:hypothetical protein
MSSPSGPQQSFPDNQQQVPPPAGQPGQFPPAGGQFPPPGDPNQGGFPPPQGGGFQPAAPQPPRRSGGGWGKRVGGIVATLLVAGAIFGVNTYLNRDAATKAKVGECVAQESGDDLKVVECGSADADFKVVGRVENKTETEAENACEPFVDQGATQLYWEGKAGKKGLVLCLGPVS